MHAVGARLSARIALVAGIVGLLAPAACQREALRTPEGTSAGFADVYPALLVTNPRALVAIEADGFSLGDVLSARDWGQPRREDYAEESAKVLMRSPIYSDLVAALRRDIDELVGSTPHAGVGLSFEHRVFDIRWLTSERAHFELVGLVNRLDLRLLQPPGCGQTRLVYRLTYRPPGRPSTRLPFTLNVIYENRTNDCAALARDWLAVEQGAGLLDRLRSGPLAKLDGAHVDRIEVNVQSLRGNAQDRTTDDHAEYLLRGFNVVDGALVADALRNTPDAGLAGAKRDALRRWIAANVEAIDVGSAELPAEFLGRQAVSVTPRGLTRKRNLPYSALFPDVAAAFGDLALTGRRLTTTPAALVRRLDQMTCVGCHQSQSVAGFHLLGEERTDARFNALTLGVSEHLRQILAWRHRFLVAASKGALLDDPVPFAEHADDEGGYGAHCSVRSSGVSSELPVWTCAPGFTCEHGTADGDPVGICLPEGAVRAGDPCENVRIGAEDGPRGVHVTPDPYERCEGSPQEVCTASLRCRSNQQGFPGGMCGRTCFKEGELEDGALCTRIPRVDFEALCFKAGTRVEECMMQPGNFALELLRTCSRTSPCRDDFVCGRTVRLPIDEGACMPPYFIFQARIDGPPLDR